MERQIRCYPNARGIFLSSAVIQQWKGPSKEVVSKQPLKSFQAEVGHGPGEVNRGFHFGSAGAGANLRPRSKE